MGKQDNATKKYVSRNDVFADIANYYLFAGKQIIKEENLSEKDITELTLAYKDLSEIIAKQKLRDVLKQCVLKSTAYFHILIIGIENQTDIHYAMPIKNLIYDALNYSAQVDTIARKHTREMDLTGAEFLSGFGKNDKLIPVITITIYWGADEWDAPRSLYDMFENVDASVLKFVDNYHINLIAPNEIKVYSVFRSTFGNVMEFIAASKNQKQISHLMQQKETFYKNVDIDTAHVIKTCANIKIDLNQYNNEGGIDMCKAWEDQRNDGIEYGRAEGLENGLESGLKALVHTLKNFLPDIDSIYNAIIQNAEYADVTKESVMKYYH